MGRAILPFKEMFAAAANDPENVPVYIYITGLSLRMGLIDPWYRLLPIAAGLASIPVWAIWTRIQFGSRISLLVAGLFALATFHVRYSQELRSLPLPVPDRRRHHDDWRSRAETTHRDSDGCIGMRRSHSGVSPTTATC